jgi:hypothetical protein
MTGRDRRRLDVGLSGNGEGLRRIASWGEPKRVRPIREAPQTARIYLARACYAEDQAQRCAEEEARVFWLDSAREYRLLARKHAKIRKNAKASRPIRR